MSALRPGGGGGGGAVTREALLATLQRTYALTSAEGWSSASGVTFGDGIVFDVPANTVSVGAVGTTLTTARTQRGPDYDIISRVERLVASNDGRWRMEWRFGRDESNCGVLRIFGAGSMELGYLVDGSWTLVFGAGGSADVRALMDAGELVVFLRRRAGTVTLAIAAGATIADAMASGTEVRASSVDAGLLSNSDGQLVRFGIDATVDVIAATTTALREMRGAVGVFE